MFTTSALHSLVRFNSLKINSRSACAYVAAFVWLGVAVRPAAADDNKPVEFKLQFGDQPLYYEIETEFRDSGGVPPLISYSTSIKDRRSIIQRKNSPTSQPVVTPGSPLVSVWWDCDRYEAREQGMKEESVYDSLRHTFAPGSLHELEGNADCKVAFLIDPSKADVSNILITPGVISNTALRRGSMGKTVEKCCPTQGTFKNLLDNMAWLWWPQGPKKVGDHWDRTLVEPQGTFGILTTVVTTKLVGIKKVEGRDVAMLDITSQVTLKPTPPPAVNPAIQKQPVHQPVNPAIHRGQPITPKSPNVTLPPPKKPQPAAPGVNKSPTPQMTPSQPGAAAPTTQPARVPTSAPVQKSPQQKEFRMEKGTLSGNVEFDLTRGEIVQVTVRRESMFVADVESQGMGKMQLRSGTAQSVHFKASHTPPPKPVIVGGKTPPKLSAQEKESLESMEKARVATTQSTTQPSGHRPTKIMTNPGMTREGMPASRASREVQVQPKGGTPVKRSHPPGPTSRPQP